MLKVEGEMNLFAVFPIGATIQDRGKRKRSDVDVTSHFVFFTYVQIKKRNLK